MLLPQALLLSLSFTPPQLYHATISPGAARLTLPSMRVEMRKILFTRLDDPARCVSVVRDIVADMARWTEKDWEMLDVPPLLAKDEPVARGVDLHFYKNKDWQDGTLQIRLSESETPMGLVTELVWTTLGSRRGAQEDFLYKLVLEEVRIGRLKSTCDLVPLVHPPSAEASRRYTAIWKSRMSA